MMSVIQGKDQAHQKTLHAQQLIADQKRLFYVCVPECK